MNALATTAAASGTDTLLGALGVIGIVIAYWAPTIIAAVRHVPAWGQILIVNLFLGWTGIGWVVALVMAFRAVPGEAAPTR